MECVQYARELSRLSVAGDGDVATMLSILADIQFGIESRMRYLLVEDVSEDNSSLYPGLISWAGFFLGEIAEKMNAEQTLTT